MPREYHSKKQEPVPDAPNLCRTVRQKAIFDAARNGDKTSKEIAEITGYPPRTIFCTLKMLRERSSILQKPLVPPLDKPSVRPLVKARIFVRAERFGSSQAYVLVNNDGVLGPFTSRKKAIEAGGGPEFVHRYKWEYRDLIKRHDNSVRAVSLSSEDVANTNLSMEINDPSALIELKDEIEALPRSYQSIVQMVCIEGYTIQEVADQLNLTTAKVQTKLEAAVRTLRDERYDNTSSLLT